MITPILKTGRPARIPPRRSVRRAATLLLPVLALAGVTAYALASRDATAGAQAGAAVAAAVVAGLADPTGGLSDRAALRAEAEAALPFALPEGFAPVAAHTVSWDARPARLLRFARADGRNAELGGEHVSLVLAADDGSLLGYTRMQADLADRALPDEAQADAAAVAFLERAAPDLVDVRRVSWIKPHAETVRTGHGSGAETAEVAGMKVKMRNTADDTWFWVIVGPDGEVVTFERDIVWVTMPGHRQTEKWLHDAWLAERADRPTG